jgi:hypothetical protein
MTFEQVESLINTDRSTSTNFTQVLRVASMKMRAAIDAKDSQAADPHAGRTPSIAFKSAAVSFHDTAALLAHT